MQNLPKIAVINMQKLKSIVLKSCIFHIVAHSQDVETTSGYGNYNDYGNYSDYGNYQDS